MAKPARRTKREAAQEPPRDTIFHHFQRTGRMQADPAMQPASDSDRDALLERISALESENAGLREAPAAVQAAQLPPAQTRKAPGADARAVKLDFTGLPDPVADLNAYNAAVQQRVAAFVEAQTHAVREETTAKVEQTAATQRLWDGFKSFAPEWAEHDKIVGLVAAEIAEQVGTQGGDPYNYMFKQSPAFYARLKKQLDEQYGGLVKQGDDDGEQGDNGNDDGAAAPGKRRKPADTDGEDDGRTAGMFSGQEAGGAPGKGKPVAKKADLISDLHDIQRRMGIV